MTPNINPHKVLHRNLFFLLQFKSYLQVKKVRADKSNAVLKILNIKNKNNVLNINIYT